MRVKDDSKMLALNRDICTSGYFMQTSSRISSKQMAKSETFTKYLAVSKAASNDYIIEDIKESFMRTKQMMTPCKLF